MRRAFVGAISAVARCIPRSLAAAACCRCGAGVLTMAEVSVDLPTILLLTFLVLLIALVTISYEVAVRQLHRVRRPPCHHGSSRALTRNASARSQLFRRYRLPPVFLAKMFEELAKLGLISFVLAILGSLELFEQVRSRSLLATRSLTHSVECAEHRGPDRQRTLDPLCDGSGVCDAGGRHPGWFGLVDAPLLDSRAALRRLVAFVPYLAPSLRPRYLPHAKLTRCCCRQQPGFWKERSQRPARGARRSASRAS